MDRLKTAKIWCCFFFYYVIKAQILSTKHTWCVLMPHAYWSNLWVHISAIRNILLCTTAGLVMIGNC